MSRRRKARHNRAVTPTDRHALFPRIGLRNALGLMAAVALLSAALVAGLVVLVRDDDRAGGTKTAAIVDQLSLTQSNPEFVASARGMLVEAGYLVDYFPGEQVTVDLYRNLPRLDYDMIILRVHSAITTEVDGESGGKTEKEYVSLFTGESYDQEKYADELLNGYVGFGEAGGRAISDPDANLQFGIGPRFIEERMEGTFDDTIIVMMGCDGLRSQRTAQAFLDKGASTFVSWSQPVSAGHTDAATERLLEKLLLEGLNTATAVSETAEEVGPDPYYGAELRFLQADG